jgi:hypothetical protein
MPFNLLLLPLLAGYLFLAKSNIRSYATSQLQKEQLLLAAAFYGLVFLIFSRVIVVSLLCTDAGRYFGEQFHYFAPFHYSGTSLGTVLLAVFLWNLSNLFVNEQVAGVWLYHRKDFDPLTRVLLQSSIGARPEKTGSGFSLFRRMVRKIASAFMEHLLHGPGHRGYWKSPKKALQLFRSLRQGSLVMSGLRTAPARAVMLNMKDTKVIVGLVVDLLAIRPAAEFVTILPIWTGYRDSDSNRLYKTVEYEDALNRVADPMDLSRVIRVGDIASATLWSESAFTIPAAPA